MPIPSAAKKQSRLFSPISEGVDPSQELRFISDLGRSLLFTVHPKKVASRVAGAIQKCVEAEVCAFVVELENIGIVSCAFDEKGDRVEAYFHPKTLDLVPTSRYPRK